MDSLVRQFLMGSSSRRTDPFFEYTTLLLSGNGTNGAQNNTFLDGSTNNFTITRNGNTTQGTFSPFSQTGWGNYFGGSSDYLTVASSIDLAAGSGAFTIEMWVFTADTSTMFFGSLTTGGLGFGYNIDNGSQGLWLGKVGIGPDATSGVQLTYNQWNHIAVIRDASNNVKFFVNGNQSGSTQTVTTNYGTSAQSYYVARDISGIYYAGYISNLRYIKGQSILGTATSFTPPTSALTSTTVGWTGTGVASSITGTVSLLTCQSNRFVDNSTTPKTITVNGSPSVQAFSPFNPTSSWSAATNGGSGYFDGNGDYITCPSSTGAPFDFGTGNFTIEGWFYAPTSSVNSANIFGISQGGGASQKIVVYIDGNATIQVDVNGSSIASTTSGYANTNLPNRWVHIALVRTGTGTNQVTLYVNGAVATQGTLSVNFTSFTNPFNVGRFGEAYLNTWTGYISNFRVVKGTAVYTGAFTPPIAPLSTSGSASASAYSSTTNVNTSFASSECSLLLNFTNAGIYDATSKNDLETVGNAQISTTQSKFGGGSMAFDGSGDALQANGIAASGIFNQLTASGKVSTIEMWLYVSAFTSPRAFLIGSWSATPSNVGWTYDVDSNGDIFISNDTAGNTVALSPKVTTGAWQHLAFVNDGTNLTIYLNGNNVGSRAVQTPTSYIGPIYIGQRSDGTLPLNGYIDDLRITKGIARYTSNFTPPTSAFPTL